MKRLPWMPRYCRELARDVIDPATLPPAEREYYLKFLAEYYGASAHGISAPEHIAESNRRRAWDQRQDLFSAGLRAPGEVPDVDGSVGGPSPLDTPEAKALLAKIRAVRPEFDEKDGRRKAKFRSALAERRFYALQKQLKALLRREEDR